MKRLIAIIITLIFIFDGTGYGLRVPLSSGNIKRTANGLLRPGLIFDKGFARGSADGELKARAEIILQVLSVFRHDVLNLLNACYGPFNFLRHEQFKTGLNPEIQNGAGEIEQCLDEFRQLLNNIRLDSDNSEKTLQPIIVMLVKAPEIFESIEKIASRMIQASEGIELHYDEPGRYETFGLSMGAISGLLIKEKDGLNKGIFDSITYEISRAFENFNIPAEKRAKLEMELNSKARPIREKFTELDRINTYWIDMGGRLFLDYLEELIRLEVEAMQSNPDHPGLEDPEGYLREFERNVERREEEIKEDLKARRIGELKREVSSYMDRLAEWLKALKDEQEFAGLTRTLKEPVHNTLVVKQEFEEIYQGILRLKELFCYFQGKREREELDINTIVLEACNLAEKEKREDKKTVHLECMPGIPRFSASGPEIMEILMNLIINARHAVEAVRDGRVWVSADFDKATNSIVIKVEDNGAGIKKENLPPNEPNVFTYGFTTKGAGKGSGIGLARVKEIVGSYNGSIEIESITEEDWLNAGKPMLSPALRIYGRFQDRKLIREFWPEIKGYMEALINGIEEGKDPGSLSKDIIMPKWHLSHKNERWPGFSFDHAINNIRQVFIIAHSQQVLMEKRKEAINVFEIMRLIYENKRPYPGTTVTVRIPVEGSNSPAVDLIAWELVPDADIFMVPSRMLDSHKDRQMEGYTWHDLSPEQTAREIEENMRNFKKRVPAIASLSNKDIKELKRRLFTNGHIVLGDSFIGTERFYHLLEHELFHRIVNLNPNIKKSLEEGYLNLKALAKRFDSVTGFGKYLAWTIRDMDSIEFWSNWYRLYFGKLELDMETIKQNAYLLTTQIVTSDTEPLRNAIQFADVTIPSMVKKSIDRLRPQIEEKLKKFRTFSRDAAYSI